MLVIWGQSLVPAFAVPGTAGEDPVLAPGVTLTRLVAPGGTAADAEIAYAPLWLEATGKPKKVTPLEWRLATGTRLWWEQGRAEPRDGARPCLPASIKSRLSFCRRAPPTAAV